MTKMFIWKQRLDPDLGQPNVDQLVRQASRINQTNKTSQQQLAHCLRRRLRFDHDKSTEATVVGNSVDVVVLNLPSLDLPVTRPVSTEAVD